MPKGERMTASRAWNLTLILKEFFFSVYQGLEDGLWQLDSSLESQRREEHMSILGP